MSAFDRSRPACRTLLRSLAWLPFFLLGPLSAPAGAQNARSPLEKPSLEDLPVVERFVSPVGDPLDYTQPAPGEAHGYALTRGVQRKRDRHLGLDLSNRRSGGEVRAPADGIVLESRRCRGWGQLVVIAHRLPGGDLVLSLLAHLKSGSVTVKPGERVSAGQAVAAVGSSGRSTGPHLHLEFRRLGHADPWRALWEHAPALDPLRILGHSLADALVPGWDGHAPHFDLVPALDHWGNAYLQAVLGSGRGPRTDVGDPDATLQRREFYTWLARLSGGRLSARSSWKTVRRFLEHRGLAGLPVAGAAALAPVGRDEAAAALSRLLSSDFLPGVPEDARVSKNTLRRQGLVLPAPELAPGAAPVAGPDRPLSRAEGALLVMGARSWPGASAGRP